MIGRARNVPAAAFQLRKDRIATQCPCCGSENLKSSPAVLMPFVAHRAFGWEPVTIDATWGLSSIKEGRAYSICKSMLCEACGFLFLDIRFSDSEMARLYDDYRGEQYNALREFYEPGYALKNRVLNAGVQYLDEVEAFLAPYVRLPVSILDWGGDTGKNTPFKDAATRLDIFDISDKPVAPGARRVDRDGALAQTYDLIVCSNVLEHVPYPSDVLWEIAHAMHASTVLYIEVPLEALIRAQEGDPHLKKRHWHEHINFFSEKSLRRLAENAGLSVRAVRALETTLCGETHVALQVACQLTQGEGA